MVPTPARKEQRRLLFHPLPPDQQRLIYFIHSESIAIIFNRIKGEKTNFGKSLNNK